VVLESHHYLYRLRAACILEPHWNRHHLAALDRIMAIAAQVDNIEEFVEQTHQLRDLTAANTLDRAANLDRIAVLHDDPWFGLQSTSAAVGAAIHLLFSSLLNLHAFPSEREELTATIHLAFRQLRSLDPDFEPGKWLGLPRYRGRLPWDKVRLSDWLQPLWPHYPNTADALPRRDTPEQSHLFAYNGVWPDAPPLELAVIEPVFRDQTRWPDDILHAHDLETRALLRAAKSPMGLEATSVERCLSRSILACHNRLQLTTLLAPFRAAIAGFPIAPALEVTGLTASQILAHPRVQFFFEHNLKPNLGTTLDGFGAQDGEAGFDLLMLAQAQPDFDFSRCLASES